METPFERLTAFTHEVYTSPFGARTVPVLKSEARRLLPQAAALQDVSEQVGAVGDDAVYVQVE